MLCVRVASHFALQASGGRFPRALQGLGGGGPPERARPAVFRSLAGAGNVDACGRRCVDVELDALLVLARLSGVADQGPLRHPKNPIRLKEPGNVLVASREDDTAQIVLPTVPRDRHGHRHRCAPVQHRGELVRDRGAGARAQARRACRQPPRKRRPVLLACGKNVVWTQPRRDRVEADREQRRDALAWRRKVRHHRATLRPPVAVAAVAAAEVAAFAAIVDATGLCAEPACQQCGLARATRTQHQANAKIILQCCFHFRRQLKMGMTRGFGDAKLPCDFL
mmetsp:Transcript_150501/g.483826  ORF Transcript_150501/g.483826 Transcript_150501/m.483826 type:complete len:281 (-) Transcript_150501:625-1467(-)